MPHIALTLAALCLSTSQSEDAVAPRPYPALTNTRREVVNFNVEPVRPLAPATNGTLYTINTHGSQLLWFGNFDPTPDLIAQTVLNPVSIALWGENRVLVAGAGTHALALHDRATGEILNVLQLPSEPADMVIDTDLDCAFIACQGANVVVKVHLPTFTKICEHPVDAERPRFLSFEQGLDETSDNRVVVASFISGNGSLVFEAPPNEPLGLSHIFDPYSLVGGPTMPDEDLFSIDTNLNTATFATPVKKRVGTMVTAHGRHPNGSYWALNVESLNQANHGSSEPDIRGEFALNRAWIGSIAAPLAIAPLVEQHDLDVDPSSSTGYSPATAVAFPFGLAFGTPPNGVLNDTPVLVTSPLNDVVVQLDAAGTVVNRVQMPTGSIPFDVEFNRLFLDIYFVYCWGTNEVIVRSLPVPSFSLTLDLGIDPTPDPIRRGREIWYDGHRSMNARTSCNTCHPGGKSDFIGWQISDNPSDRKNVMVTQSLLGIEDTFPYHWRGERALIDFNGAFEDLLGHTARLTEGANSEFEDFQAFVFSLQPHANPREAITRDIPFLAEEVGRDPQNNPILGNPHNGQTLFETRVGFNAMTCAECHTPQSGTNGDYISEVITEIVTAQTLESAHLRELTHKDHRILFLPSLTRARNGFGLGHNGLANGVLGFIQGGSSFNLTGNEPSDVAAFVRRFDQGIAPTAHVARMLDVSHLGNAGDIQNLLIPHASNGLRWIDVIAFGRFINPATGVSRVGRWWFNPSSNLFDCNDPAVPSVPFSTLLAQAQLNQAKLAFLGIPPSNGFRVALDPDHDRRVDGKEMTDGTDIWNPDTDGDGQRDGYEIDLGSDPTDATSLGIDNVNPTGTAVIDFVNAALAKLEIDASEEVRISATFSYSGGPTHVSETPVFARKSTLVLQGLDASTPPSSPAGATSNQFSCTLTLTDRSGNVGTVNVAQFTSGDMTIRDGSTTADTELILQNLTGSRTTSGNTMTVNATAQVSQRFADPLGINATAVKDRVVAFQVLVETAPGSNLYDVDPNATTTLGTFVPTIDLADTNGNVHSITSSAFTGKFLLAPVTTLASNGATSFNFSVGGLTGTTATPQKVRVRLVAILTPRPTAGFTNVFADNVLLGLLSLPATPISMRGLQFQYP